MKSVLINLVLFNAAWLACVFSAAAGIPLAGVAAVAAAVAIHLARSTDSRSEVVLMILAAALGLSWESALVSSGLLIYDVGLLLPGIAPYWIVAMWVLFATTLNVGMRWLRKSIPLASVTGAIGGPMSFLAGEKAGAVAFADSGTALAAIAIGWAILLPLVVRVSVWLESTEARLAPQLPKHGEEA